MSEATMLMQHGTTLSRLKMQNIVQAAQADLRLRERKLDNKAEPEVPYSFVRKHVWRAQSAAHLIALAYFEPHAAAATDKQSTMIVYRDRELLREALRDLLGSDVLDHDVVGPEIIPNGGADGG